MLARSSSFLGVVLLSTCVFLAVTYANSVYGKEILITAYREHSFDASIKDVLGYDKGAVLYFSELSAITSKEQEIRSTYEPFGCYPLYLLKDGERRELGYDCQTFFCVGYFLGTPQCRDRDGQPFGGDVEIRRRIDEAAQGQISVTLPTYESLGDELPAEYQQRLKQLNAVACTPYFVAEWNVIFGDGYRCTSAGHFIPFTESFSPAYDCRKMWFGARSVLNSKYKYENADGYYCDLMVDTDDFKLRQSILRQGIAGEQTARDFLEEAIRTDEAAASRSSVAASHSKSSHSVLTTSFTDVRPGDYGAQAIQRLQAIGIVQGYSDGTYRPQQTVNRAELNKLLIAGLHSQESQHEANCFPDVGQEWFSTYVCAAKRLGWVNGYADGRFQPANTINRAEAIKILVASLSSATSAAANLPSDVEPDSWYASYVGKAVALRIITEPEFRPADSLTRAEIAVWIDRALK